MRALFTTMLELAGAAVVTWGAFMFAHPVGVVVGGLCLIGLGYLLGRDPE